MAARPPSAGGPFSPESQVLEEAEREHAEERVAVKSPPAAPFVVVEPELVLHLLVRLLAAPARLDGPGQRAAPGAGRMIAQVVLALSARSAFADEPRGLARQMAAVGPARAVGHADADGGEVEPKRSRRAQAPGNGPEGPRAERVDHRGGAHGLRRGHGVLARAAGRGGLRPLAPNVGRIDVLGRQNADGVAEPPRGKVT